MSAPTRTTRVPATFHEDATVLRAGRDGLAVRTADGEERSAARAVSCVVEPREGDRVMMASLHDGAAFVIAVLQRPGDPSAVWSGAGDVTVAAPQGRVAVAAAHGVDVLTGGEVRIDADSLGVVTRAADLAADGRADTHAMLAGVSFSVIGLSTFLVMPPPAGSSPTACKCWWSGRWPRQSSQSLRRWVPPPPPPLLPPPPPRRR